MGVFKKAFDNVNGSLESLNSILDTQIQLQNADNLRAIRQLQEQQAFSGGTSGTAVGYKERSIRNRVKDNPECMKKVKVKQREILEKTGNKASVDDIIDVLYSDADDLTGEEKAELAAIQKQYEDEEEAKVDAELAERGRLPEQKTKQSTSSAKNSIGTMAIVMIMIGITIAVAIYILSLIP